MERAYLADGASHVTQGGAIADRKLVRSIALKGTDLLLRLYNADNEVFLFLDGALIGAQKTEGDPSFQKDFSVNLGKGRHQLVVGGINWGGPAHFKWVLILDNALQDDIDWKAGSTANGLAYYVAYEIMTP
jgi:hypothetical protein